MRLLVFLFIFSVSLEAVGVEKDKCAGLLEQAPSLHAAKVEIAELMLEQARLGRAEAALNSLLKKNIKQKIKEFKTTFGVELDPEEIKGIVARIESGALEKKEEAAKKEQEARVAETEAIMKWRRQKIHDEVKFAGPFIKDSQFFTGKNKNLAIYDLKENKYVWDESLKDGQSGQEISGWSELLLTPKKDLLVIVNRDSIGLLDTKTGDYKNGALKTSLDRGFRFAKISQDGTHLFLGGEDGESIIYELPGLKPVFGKTKGDYPHGKGIVESPDGRYVFFVRHNGNQVLFDLKEKIEIQLPELKSSKFHHCQDAIFSKDSQTLTIGNHNSWFLDFDIPTRTLNPSKYKSYRGQELFTTADGEYVIIGRDSTRPKEKEAWPFTILKASTGDDVTPELSQFELNNVSQLWFFPEHSKLVFRDTIRELGASHPEHNYLYMFDLKSFEVSRYEYDPKLFFMTVAGFTPDGQSLLTTGNGGPVIEFY